MLAQWILHTSTYFGGPGKSQSQLQGAGLGGLEDLVVLSGFRGFRV